jgi:hypothetical protein
MKVVGVYASVVLRNVWREVREKRAVGMSIFQN